ncbi:hypothetical protein CK203_115501 [Vitis vinifera]|uniref:Uncharacterized protein n=1 Tax=Vitis vinifera TaxID=29760 RepID=A0A438BNR6_VITVI|nr:hypothetical protein CK203_115501 [Vitis vinifera]
MAGLHASLRGSSSSSSQSFSSKLLLLLTLLPLTLAALLSCFSGEVGSPIRPRDGRRRPTSFRAWTARHRPPSATPRPPIASF